MVSDFNDQVTSRMLTISKEKAEKLRLKISHVCHVPGAYDMPLVVDRLLQQNDVDAVVTLGAIIKGQTKHDELIANSTTNHLTKLSLKYQKPVSLGITGPGMKEKQAYARIRPVAERAVEAVSLISKELVKIKK